jgi:medium-chain acyl-[acyl-carrier-protein] hydrolase
MSSRSLIAAPPASAWLPRQPADAAEQLRLVCFPYAGGGAHIYAEWRAGLPAQVGLYPLQLPGRGRRFSEPALLRLDAVVAGAVEALASLDDKPFVLFGHSMGALLAFETARALRRLGRRGPLRLLVSGYRAPQLPRDTEPIHQLPDDAFAARLRQFEGTPPEVFTNAELLQLMVPIVRADFTVVETHVHQDEPPLACPVTAFGGLADGHFGRNAVAAWAAQTTGAFRLHMLEGSHFFLNTARLALLRLVSADLEHDLAMLAQCRRVAV